MLNIEKLKEVHKKTQSVPDYLKKLDAIHARRFYRDCGRLVRNAAEGDSYFQSTIDKMAVDLEDIYTKISGKCTRCNGYAEDCLDCGR